MKNKDQYAVAVRKPDNEIIVDKQEYHSISEKYKFLKLPILRGVVAFVESLSVGMKTLTFSASFYEEEEEKQDKTEQSGSVMMGLTLVLALMLAIGIFIVLPWFLTERLATIITEPRMQALVEGGIRLGIFILYVVCISMTKDIRRVYMYHGAEHKTINCVENGLELTVENVRRQSKEHRRCGTSFMLYVMVISIIFFMFIRVDNAALRMLFRILLVPVIAGISYEFIRFTGRYDNLLTRILSRPGMWMQALTTREPDDDMIEVAICSVEAVFDWKAYIAELEEEKSAMKSKRRLAPKVVIEESEEEYTPAAEAGETVKVAPLKKADSGTRRGAFFNDVPEQDNKESGQGTSREVESDDDIQSKAVAVKRAGKVRRPMQPIEELRKDSILADAEEDDDDDEILSALDKFFE